MSHYHLPDLLFEIIHPGSIFPFAIGLAGGRGAVRHPLAGSDLQFYSWYSRHQPGYYFREQPAKAAW